MTNIPTAALGQNMIAGLGFARLAPTKGNRTYSSWSHMRGRCLNSDHHAYDKYGGRGIRICERWNSFANFVTDMGERPPGKTLDRFPNKDGGYEPGNCRWATPLEQSRNQRRFFIDITGSTFGMLTAMKLSHFNKGAYWHFTCECGVKVVKALGTVLSSGTKSCGCSRKKWWATLSEGERAIRIKVMNDVMARRIK